jgi:predicted metal-dependent HD superfamily phosphohydrolase
MFPNIISVPTSIFLTGERANSIKAFLCIFTFFLLAKNNLQKLAIEDSKIGTVFSQVLATQSHQNNSDIDTNYFTDADLSILGESWENYQVYSNQIRAEYIQYADDVYIRGRLKVLNHFLEMERIFKTPHFYNLYELKAKQNLENEIKLLKQNL